MTSEIVPIKKYKLCMGNRLKNTWNNITAIFNGYVICYGEKHRVIVYFLSENSPVPAQYYLKDKKFAVMFVPSCERYEYTDVLRNEKSVCAYLNDTEPEKMMIMTQQEPIGQGEID
ncbi:MAG: hypothetical protein OEV85_08250 [Candidatus Thorarchaeota archaeon]|nr:hypothetical protein [Candidatus Thorarchaeota archaeon]